MGHAEFCRQTWLSLSSLFPTGIELIFQRFPGDREFLLREFPVGSMLLVGDRYAQGNPQWRHSRRLDPDHSLCNLLFLWQVLWQLPIHTVFSAATSTGAQNSRLSLFVFFSPYVYIIKCPHWISEKPHNSTSHCCIITGLTKTSFPKHKPDNFFFFFGWWTGIPKTLVPKINI